MKLPKLGLEKKHLLRGRTGYRETQKRERRARVRGYQREKSEPGNDFSIK